MVNIVHEMKCSKEWKSRGCESCYSTSNKRQVGLPSWSVSQYWKRNWEAR